MKLVSSLAIAASLIVGGVAAPAVAQKKKEAAAAEAPQRKYDISKGAAKAINELQTATKTNAPDFAVKLAAAEAVAKSVDDKYVIAKFRLQKAQADNDQAGQLAAVDAILASGGADPVETRQLNAIVASTAFNKKDFARAETAYAAIAAANPSDPNPVVDLARTKIELNKKAEALALLQKAIALSTAANQNAPESWYRSAVGIAYELKNDALAGQLAAETQRLYPNEKNFQNLIALQQAKIAKDEQAYVDLLRLMQVSGTMGSATDYLRLAEHFEYEKNWGEAKSVLEAAARAGKTSAGHGALLARVSARVAEDKAALPTVEPKARSAATGALAQSLASVYAGYGNYPKAIELYRLALQKGGVDANLINTRLGIVHAAAGQRAEAEAAFKAVTGLRAPLAALWLSWLAQRG